MDLILLVITSEYAKLTEAGQAVHHFANVSLLPQLQHQCQTMCIQADQLHCLISTGSKQLS